MSSVSALVEERQRQEARRAGRPTPPPCRGRTSVRRTSAARDPSQDDEVHRAPARPRRTGRRRSRSRLRNTPSNAASSSEHPAVNDFMPVGRPRRQQPQREDQGGERNHEQVDAVDTDEVAGPRACPSTCGARRTGSPHDTRVEGVQQRAGQPQSGGARRVADRPAASGRRRGSTATSTRPRGGRMIERENGNPPSDQPARPARYTRSATAPTRRARSRAPGRSGAAGTGGRRRARAWQRR